MGKKAIDLNKHTNKINKDIIDISEYINLDIAYIWKRIISKIIDVLLLFLLILPLYKLEINGYVAIMFINIKYLYEILFLYFFGKTIGMMLVRIEAVSVNGGNITLKQSFIRAVCEEVSLYALGVGYLWMLINDCNQTWHDIFSKIIIINSRNNKVIKEKFKKAPWDNSKKLVIHRRIIATISLFIIIITSVNKLVEDIGKVGINQISKTTFKALISNVKAYDIDKDGKNELIALAVENDNKMFKVYRGQDDELVLLKSYIIDGNNISKQTYINDFKMVDLNGDDNEEILLSNVTIKNNEVVNEINVYTFDNDRLELSEQVLEITNHKDKSRPNFEIFKDLNNKLHLVYVYDQKLKSYIYVDGAFKEEYSTLTVKNTALVKANFLDEDSEKIYWINQYNKDVEIYEIQFDNGIINKKKFGTIKDNNIEHISGISNNYIRTDDINGDGQDEFILAGITKTRRKRLIFEKYYSTWFNIYSFENNNWMKIWYGGNIDVDKQFKYETKLDVDNDGDDEIIMTKVEGNKTNVYVYKQQKKLFELNTLYLKLHKYISQ